MWPWQQRESDIERLLREQVLQLQGQLDRLQSRNDRLVECIAAKADMPIFLPQEIPASLSPAQGWWDKKQPGDTRGGK